MSKKRIKLNDSIVDARVGVYTLGAFLRQNFYAIRIRCNNKADKYVHTHMCVCVCAWCVVRGISNILYILN